MIIASAPGRCGLIGNPTDMYGGSVISCSVKERATSTLIQDTDEIIITVSGNSRTIKCAEDLAFREHDYLNVACAVLQALELEPENTIPFHLQCETEIPMQAGLAGSTAMLSTIVGCLLKFLEITLNPYQLVELIRKIEYDYLKIICGFQDHSMAVFGGLNYMDFRDRRADELGNGTAPFVTVEPLSPYVGELPIVLAHTGVKHHSGSVHKSILQRWTEGEAAVVEGQLEIAQLARSGKKALLSSAWDELGTLMNRNHAIQRDLGGSGEANETLIAAALRGGALGAKLAGAGAGGTILALTLDPERTIQALIDAGSDKILIPVPSPGLTVQERV